MKYKIILTEKGEGVYKGGNIEVMNKMLITFEAENEKKAQKFYDNKIYETVGSGSRPLYTFVEVEK